MKAVATLILELDRLPSLSALPESTVDRREILPAALIVLLASILFMLAHLCVQDAMQVVTALRRVLMP